MGENIFALQLSAPQPQQVVPVSGIAWDQGLRAVLSVRNVWAKLQTTILFGDSLYMIWYDIGQLSRQDGFKAFLKPYFGTSVPAAQLSQPPFAATPNLYMQYPGLPIPAPAPPVATGRVTMLNAGFDPFRGYWIEFAGNYYLTFTLFKNWPNVIPQTANYLGAQPSANNPNPSPGSGGSGGGVGGGSNGPGGGSSTC